MTQCVETLVSVHCYAGDAAQVQHFLPSYVQHGCQVVIMSPEDSPVVIPGVECRHLGKRAYIGQASLDRQRLHMTALLSYPARFFLMHDADSLFLSPKIPDYLYESEDIVYSNEVHDYRTHPWKYSPRLAFQPPYFIGRSAMEKMLAVVSKTPIDPQTPFIDYFMMALAFEAGLDHRRFPECVSFGTGIPENEALMIKCVSQDGKYILHSVKSPALFDKLCVARTNYCSQH